MDPQIWTDVNVAVQTALAAAITVTGITKGNPTVVQAAGHALAADTIVLLRVKGIGGLDYAVGKVGDPEVGTFDLVGVDSTAMKGTFVSGTVQAITFGAVASTLQDITPSGGESADVNITTIHPIPDYAIPGKPSPIVYSFGSLWVPDDPALVALKAAGAAKQVRAVQFEWPDGTQLLFAGMPSASMAPGGSSGGAVTTPLKINVRGPLAAYAGVDA